MGKNFAAIAATTALFLMLFVAPAMAVEPADTAAVKPADTFGKSGDQAFGDSLLTWDGEANTRFYFKLYEAGRTPSSMGYAWAPANLWMTLKGRLGATADFTETLFRLSVSTGNHRETESSLYYEQYGNGCNVYPRFYMLSDFNAYVEEAYALWRASDKTNIFMGRFSFKAVNTVISSMTFHPDYAADGFGIHQVLMDGKNMNASASFHLAWLGSTKDTVSSGNPQPGYRHNFLIGIQPKIKMAMESGMKVLASLGFWAITHPNSINDLDPTAPKYGDDAAMDGSDPVDVNLMLVEAFLKLNINADINIWAHFGVNLGAGVYPFGLMAGFNYGSVKKQGDMAFGVTLFYLEKYVWYKPFIDGKLGLDNKGILLSMKYGVASKLTFYFSVAFKNAINAPNDSNGDSIITGQMFAWTGFVIKFDTKPKK